MASATLRQRGAAAAPSIGVVLITHRARRHLDRCLPPLLASPLSPRVLVVNSSSNDGTVEHARALGAETWIVPREEFNHGLTREQARRRLGTDVVVMLTPDAYPADERFLEKLVQPIVNGRAAVAYGRQVADLDADLVATYGREFNYPRMSQTRGLEDWPAFGSYTHFCSNACAAWSSAALDRIGGFVPTLVSEETIAVVKLLQQGLRIAYVANAVVLHSHPTSLVESFRRQFDIGWTRQIFKPLLLARERDEVRGRAYLHGLVQRTARDHPRLLPWVIADSAAKLLGYRLGRLGPWLPRAVCRRLSGQDYFWSSNVRQLVGVQPASIAGGAACA